MKRDLVAFLRRHRAVWTSCLDTASISELIWMNSGVWKSEDGNYSREGTLGTS
ncbi:hypothetical protein [Rhodanobacter sp. MP7CTX1]|uniref:hypothetical protein n=1 Tax=Rhodanobacter sp. MP7CTX1 TaxID=2723084 RepID=UPI001618F84F|nr:hypothetical protein [Rhodanobacter sp. MP7CTX1]MBB6187110.1 hypothetical protein [Rhodanobacter sp. MP7CTX1]